MNENRLRGWTVAAMCVALVALLRLHLVAALLSGLLVHEVVHAVAPRIAFRGMGRSRARLLTVGLIAGVVIGALVAVTLFSVALLRAEVGPDNPMARLADVLEQSTQALPMAIREHLPADPQALRSMLVDWARDHTSEVQRAGRAVVLAFGHVLFGAIIGAMICVREARGAEGPTSPVARHLSDRMALLATVFRRVVFAQIKISFVNTVLTAGYLYLALPAIGVDLPLRKTMVAITFVAGLLPIIGNLISNTVIVLVSLSISFGTAAGSLIFLLVLHKLEYFLNARIVGYQIKAAAWELVCAMLVAEAAFGIPGLVAAPIFYAYVKDELKAIGWL